MSEALRVVSEPGQPTAAILELAFWEAITRCAEDETVPLTVSLCVDGDVGGLHLGPKIPHELWEHMAAAFNDLKAAAGV